MERADGGAEDLTLFVGAGISVPSGAPDFRALRDLFLRPLIGDDVTPEELEELGMDRFTPELLFDALDDGREVTRRMIRRAMWQACERCMPGPNHAAVALLGAAGARVWTTNFDTLIERAAVRLGIPCTVIAAPDDARRAERERRPGTLVLLKVHGSFPYTGDPAVEPEEHDYSLLFRATDVWRTVGQGWEEQLGRDLDGRDVRLFGYRGADLDLIPPLLAHLPAARGTVWWETTKALDNAEILRRRFGRTSERIRIRVGEPSDALIALAEERSGRSLPPAARRTPPPVDVPVPRTFTARAAVRGQFVGAAAARRAYAGALVRDPWALKPGAALRIVRSAGYDIPAVNAAFVRALRVAAWVAPNALPASVWELYAMFVDARRLARSDRRDLVLLANAPVAASAGLLIRVASKEKRIGLLSQAAGHLHEAFAELRERERPAPALEAMATYNLAWIERQRWRPEARSSLLEDYSAERMASIGFNWAAWLFLDDALLALDRGDVETAAAKLDDPFLSFARGWIDHPAFRADEAQACALLAWHRGAADVAKRLDDSFGFALRSTGGRLGFTAIDTLVLLAERERVLGRRAGMEAHLRRAAHATRSTLQRARIALVRAAAAEEPSGLEAVARTAEADGLGLVAASARAALSGTRPGGAPAAPGVPLAGLC